MEEVAESWDILREMVPCLAGGAGESEEEEDGCWVREADEGAVEAVAEPDEDDFLEDEEDEENCDLTRARKEDICRRRREVSQSMSGRWVMLARTEDGRKGATSRVTIIS